ncbi:PKD domain-containing protein [Geodermatophilus marinus]|uniref:PKD domain-containing protein n=1 Tax=Geodermatophilus sp. LHW52908 TaxID=2303986 RepID=UPI0011C19F33|nr:hypothetical protein [Geodermatophilus sp. LHW52908]
MLTLTGGVATIFVPSTAQAAVVEASLVATRPTSTWARPSPDPSGITYNPATNRLIISDGEVEEMQWYAGTNLFISRLDGVQDADFPGGTTVPWSYEPAGVGYRPSTGHLFVSDDDKDRIFQVQPGPDSRHGTPDDTITSFSTRGIGNNDPEDVAVDLEFTRDGNLLVIDGTNKEVWLYGPGPDGVFNGVPPAGDDTATHFDVERHGAMDPEGIAYHPARDTILVLDSQSKQVYEVDRQGNLLNVVKITAAKPRAAAGIAVAPASNGSGALNLYIVDRGVDNWNRPDENDGRFYEMAVAFPPLTATNAAPTVSAGPDAAVTLPDGASLSGSVTDDGLPAGSSVTAAWSMVSGPGTVTFADPASASTTATFSAAGSYVLRLTGSDGELSAQDDVAVEVSGGAPPPTNTPPTVSAGPDAAVTLPDGASLSGSVTDDGLPAGSSVTAAWSMVSGPGTVTFADPASASTTATFSAAGSYVLRLTGSDGELSAQDDVAVEVTSAEQPQSGVLDVPVRSGGDDAEQRRWSTSLASWDLQLGVDGTMVQTVGLRFSDVAVPPGARITNAYVQFQVDEAGTAAANFTVAGQAADDAPAFTTASQDISSRPLTGATVSWAAPSWPTINARTADQRTPDLAAVLQEIVDRPGWGSGNAVVIVINGEGTRTAKSFESGAARAPVLHLEWTTG